MSSVFDPQFQLRRPNTSGHFSRDATIQLLEALLAEPDSSVNRNLDRRFKDLENSFNSRLNTLQSSQVEISNTQNRLKPTIEDNKDIRDLISKFVSDHCDTSNMLPRASSYSDDVYLAINQYIYDNSGLNISRRHISSILKELGHPWDQSDSHYFFRNLKLRNLTETAELQRPVHNPIPFSPAPGQGTSRIPQATPFQTPAPSPAPVFQSARR